MSEIKITINAPELTAAIRALADAVRPGVAPAPAPVAPPAPVPVAPPAAPAPAPVAPPVPVPVAPPATSVPVAPAPAFTLEQISRAGVQLVDAGKMPQLMGLLNKYGVQAVTQLDPSTYGAVATELRSLGAQI